METSPSVLLRMRNVSDESCRKNQNTYFVFDNFFRKSWRLWDNVEKYCRVGQATDGHIIGLMSFVCWITKATDTHSEYVTLIAFPLQQWLHERASMLCYMYIAYIIKYHLTEFAPNINTRIRVYICVCIYIYIYTFSFLITDFECFWTIKSRQKLH
jgi:hypothetical protein